MNEQQLREEIRFQRKMYDSSLARLAADAVVDDQIASAYFGLAVNAENTASIEVLLGEYDAARTHYETAVEHYLTAIEEKRRRREKPIGLNEPHTYLLALYAARAAGSSDRVTTATTEMLDALRDAEAVIEDAGTLAFARYARAVAGILLARESVVEAASEPLLDESVPPVLRGVPECLAGLHHGETERVRDGLVSVLDYHRSNRDDYPATEVSLKATTLYGLARDRGVAPPATEFDPELRSFLAVELLD
ncbi:hypothetical protein ACOZ4N_03480 [Halorientalis pallida]|uniref:hypothetical protein n=1 Tax=Halorientalis pallida TaxID=2479928 RepID=UPI003C6EF817